MQLEHLKLGKMTCSPSHLYTVNYNCFLIIPVSVLQWLCCLETSSLKLHIQGLLCPPSCSIHELPSKQFYNRNLFGQQPRASHLVWLRRPLAWLQPVPWQHTGLRKRKNISRAADPSLRLLLQSKNGYSSRKPKTYLHSHSYKDPPLWSLEEKSRWYNLMYFFYIVFIVMQLVPQKCMSYIVNLNSDAFYSISMK